MQRRSFFKLIAGAMLVPVMPADAEIWLDAGESTTLTMMPIPILWGDGIHDDAPAIQAMIDGETVEFADGLSAEGCGMVDGIVRLPAGRFCINQTVRVKGKWGFEGAGYDKTTIDFSGAPMQPFNSQTMELIEFPQQFPTNLSGLGDFA